MCTCAWQISALSNGWVEKELAAEVMDFLKEKGLSPTPKRSPEVAPPSPKKTAR
jgi:hypothetical protein